MDMAKHLATDKSKAYICHEMRRSVDRGEKAKAAKQK